MLQSKIMAREPALARRILAWIDASMAGLADLSGVIELMSALGTPKRTARVSFRAIEAKTGAWVTRVRNR